MKTLEKKLKSLSPKFALKKEEGELQLWFGYDHRLLVYKKGELTDEEILRLAEDFLEKNPELKK